MVLSPPPSHFLKCQSKLFPRSSSLTIQPPGLNATHPLESSLLMPMPAPSLASQRVQLPPGTWLEASHPQSPSKEFMLKSCGEPLSLVTKITFWQLEPNLSIVILTSQLTSLSHLPLHPEATLPPSGDTMTIPATPTSASLLLSSSEQILIKLKNYQILIHKPI